MNELDHSLKSFLLEVGIPFKSYCNLFIYFSNSILRWSGSNPTINYLYSNFRGFVLIKMKWLTELKELLSYNDILNNFESNNTNYYCSYFMDNTTNS
jgi:hypothetical protein